MSKVKVKLNSAGVRELLKSAEIAAECMGHAQRIAVACGDGYAAESRSYSERKGAAVSADTPKAQRDNLKNNTLLRALS